jgi:periplasmic divalent cation tolerance protein
MDESVILYTTWPDAETAEACAMVAVTAGLAACANILAPMLSVYRWQGVVERADEVPMLLKTTRAAAGSLRDLVSARHPYDVPCILALPAEPALSSAPYLAWISAEAKPAGPQALPRG